jgi:hypothetical protein
MPASIRLMCTGGWILWGSSGKDFDLVVNMESWATGEPRPRRALRVETFGARSDRLAEWKIRGWGGTKVKASSTQPDDHVKLALLRNFEFKLPLAWLLATPSAAHGGTSDSPERQSGRSPSGHQQAAAAVQPMAEPAAGGFVAAGGMD